MLSKYVEILKGIWGKAAEQILILKFWILLSPIINKGREINAPIALVAQNEDVVRGLFRELIGFGDSPIIPLGLPGKEFKQKMLEADYELFPMIYSGKSRESFNNFQLVKDTALSGRIGRQAFNMIPMIGFCGGIPREFRDELAGKILFEEGWTGKETAGNQEITREMLYAFTDNWPEINEKWYSQEMENPDGTIFLRDAALASQIILRREKGTNVSAELIREIGLAAGKMQEEWEILDGYDVWLDLLRDLIIRDASNIPKIVNRERVSLDESSKLDKFPMYDLQYYYLMPSYLDQHCEKWLSMNSMEVKRALSDRGILIGEGAKRMYFTVKVPALTVAGTTVTIRRLRIKRFWLDLPGEPTWQERIAFK